MLVDFDEEKRITWREFLSMYLHKTKDSRNNVSNG